MTLKDWHGNFYVSQAPGATQQLPSMYYVVAVSLHLQTMSRAGLEWRRNPMGQERFLGVPSSSHSPFLWGILQGIQLQFIPRNAN